MRVIRSLFIAFSTYSRIPVPQVDWSDENRKYSMCFFPLIGAVSKDFLLQMNYDGSDPSLHDLHSDTPLDNVAGRYPEEYERMLPLTRGLYETARYMLYENVRD